MRKFKTLRSFLGGKINDLFYVPEDPDFRLL